MQHLSCKYATTSLIDPRTKYSMSSTLDPWISNAFCPSNKNRQRSLGLDARKKLTPLHLEYLMFQAICDFCRIILLFFIIFNSIKKLYPSIQINVSGIPSPTLFSILWKNVFLGRFCFNIVDSVFSVFAIFYPLIFALKSIAMCFS